MSAQRVSPVLVGRTAEIRRLAEAFADLPAAAPAAGGSGVGTSPDLVETSGGVTSPLRVLGFSAGPAPGAVTSGFTTSVVVLVFVTTRRYRHIGGTAAVVPSGA